ncbi:hypothetical protein [Halosolutus halophilus]|uniref:hypothetical protein n=1 Tax=Halosolutus halophilus TaxID=1552990 RepID=UPI00223511C7|nr:hypothetical protein [Halosolutus halophilus]
MSDANFHRFSSNATASTHDCHLGPDGSGKTTQAKLLTERLQATGYDAQYVHALYYLSDNIPYANRLRRHLGPRKTRPQEPEHGSLYLVRRVLFGLVSFWFALLTIGMISVQVRNKRQVVVFDRYYHQFFYDVYGSASIPLSHLLPRPWRMIYLDADLTTVQTRMDTVDQAVDGQYYATVIDMYDECATPGWLSFRAELPIATLHEQIFQAIWDRSRPDRLTTAAIR